MNTDITSKLSLNEMLRIYIPGIYFTMLIDILFGSLFISKYNIEIDDAYKTIFFILLSLINGLLISSLDIPKRFCFFKNNLPINQLRKNISKNDDNIEYQNVYFQFYDNSVSHEFKIKTELNNGYYHLCTNLSIIALLGFLVGLIRYQEFNGIIWINLIIFIVSFLAATSILKNKVLSNFKRQTVMFKNSQEFKIYTNSLKIN